MSEETTGNEHSGALDGYLDSEPVVFNWNHDDYLAAKAVAEFYAVAVEPFTVDESGFVIDANGSHVLACGDDDEDCSRRYSQNAVDHDLHYVCPCGRLGQRMEEVAPERCGLTR